MVLSALFSSLDTCAWEMPIVSGVPYDLYSRKILDLKDGKRSAINYFYALLDEETCSGVAICVVPSHSPQSAESGVLQLARKLAAHDRIDMTDYLIRTKEIEKLATGGNSNIDVHLDSIVGDPRVNVTGEVILVVDDVLERYPIEKYSTTGLIVEPSIRNQMPDYLYYRGDINLLQSSVVAVIGSREISERGKAISRNITQALCKREDDTQWTGVGM